MGKFDVSTRDITKHFELSKQELELIIYIFNEYLKDEYTVDKNGYKHFSHRFMDLLDLCEDAYQDVRINFCDIAKILNTTSNGIIMAFTAENKEPVDMIPSFKVSTKSADFCTVLGSDVSKLLKIIKKHEELLEEAEGVFDIPAATKVSINISQLGGESIEISGGNTDFPVYDPTPVDTTPDYEPEGVGETVEENDLLSIVDPGASDVEPIADVPDLDEEASVDDIDPAPRSYGDGNNTDKYRGIPMNQPTIMNPGMADFIKPGSNGQTLSPEEMLQMMKPVESGQVPPAPVPTSFAQAVVTAPPVQPKPEIPVPAPRAPQAQVIPPIPQAPIPEIPVPEVPKKEVKPVETPPAEAEVPAPAAPAAKKAKKTKFSLDKKFASEPVDTSCINIKVIRNYLIESKTLKPDQLALMDDVEILDFFTKTYYIVNTDKGLLMIDRNWIKDNINGIVENVVLIP